METAQIHTRVSIRHLQSVYEMTQPGDDEPEVTSKSVMATLVAEAGHEDA